MVMTDQFDHDQHMRWLREVPGYREVIKERIDEVQRRIRHADMRREKGEQTLMKNQGVDKLGREVEGCG